MDPAIVGKRLKEIYPDDVAKDGRRYADISDAEIGTMFVLKHGDKAYSALGISKPTETSAEDKKQQRQDESAENILRVLEDLYFKGGQTKGLASGEYGAGGRLPGVAKDIERQFAPTPESEQLNTYKRILESKRTLLARAAGEVGNLALQEQIMAGKGLPDETQTPEEAFALFKESRRSLGLPERDRLKKIEQNYTLEKKGQKPSQASSTTQAPSQTSNKGIGDITLKEILSKAAQPNALVGLSNQGVDALDNPLMRALLPRFTGAKQKLQGKQLVSGDELAGAGGEYISAVLPWLGAGNIVARGAGAGLIHGATTPGLTPEERTKRAGVEGGLGAGLAGLTKLPGAIFPQGAGKKIRDTAIANAEKQGKTIDGNSLVESLKKWADVASQANPGKENMVNKILSSAQNTYTNKSLTPSGAKNIWNEVDSGFTQSGVTKTTVESSADRAMRDALRLELEKAAPGFEKGTQMISKGLKRKKWAERMIIPAAVGVPITSGLFYLASKMGMGQQGGNNQ